MPEKKESITLISTPDDLSENYRLAEINENTLVVKENLLINTPVDYTEHEQKIIALVISQIREQDKDFVPITFTVTQIAEQLQISKNKLYSELDSLTNTINRQLIFPFMRDGEVGFDKMPFFSMINYYNGKITFHINDKLKFLLLRIQEHAGKKIGKEHKITYSKYKVRYHTKLKGKYVLRLHELLVQHMYKRIIDIPIDELREFLYLGSKFAEYKDFKRRVLIPAHEEINKKTSLYFTYQPIKTGKKISAIQFHIFEKTSSDGVVKLRKELEFYGISGESIDYIFDTLQIDTETVKQNLEYVQEKMGKRQTISNIGGYLYNAITKSYATRSKKEIEIENIQYEQKVKQQEKNDYLIKIKALINNYNAEINNKIQDYIDRHSQEEVLADFLENCPSSFSKSLVKKELEKKNKNIVEIFSNNTDIIPIKSYILQSKLRDTMDIITFLRNNGKEVTELFLLENGLK